MVALDSLDHLVHRRSLGALVLLLGALQTFLAKAATLEAVDFGAIAGAQQDSASGLQRAIDAASAGDTVHLGTGVYALSKTVILRSGVALAGDGTDRSQIVVEAGSNPDVLFHGDGVVGASISDLDFDLAQGASTRLLSLVASQRVIVSRIRVRNMSANTESISLIADDLDCVVQDSEFLGMGVGTEWGAAARASWRSLRTQFLRNHVTGAGRGGFFANDGSTDTVIKGNSVRGGFLDLEVWNGCDRSVIEDNDVDAWISVASNFVAARRNRVHGTSVPGIGMEYVSAHHGVLNANDVAGGDLGFSVDGAQHGLLLNNHVKGATKFAIQGYGVSRPGYLDDVENYLHDNVWEGSSNRGLMLNQGADRWTVDGDAISGMSEAAIYVYQSQALSLKDCRVFDNPGSPLVLNADSPDISISASQFYGNGSAGPPQSDGTAAMTPPAVGLSLSAFGGAAPFTVLFDAGGSEGASALLWDFDDGPPSDSASGTHTYVDPGDYRVSLVVWSAIGVADLEQVDVHVVAPELSVDNVPVAPRPFVQGTSLCAAAPGTSDLLFFVGFSWAWIGARVRRKRGR